MFWSAIRPKLWASFKTPWGAAKAAPHFTPSWSRKMASRVEITAHAAEVVHRLKQQHGELMFHQSGGCCDGSSPMCYPVGEFRVGPQDVLLGQIAGCTFHIGAAQFEYWK